MKTIILIVAMALAGTESAFAQTQHLPENFYRHYTGTIAGQKVSVELWSIDSAIDGRYEYEKYQQLIMLEAVPKKEKNATIVLGENVEQNAVHPTNSVWKIRFTQTGISGKWISADKKKSYPIRLVESYPDGIMRFTYVEAHKKFLAFPNKKESNYDRVTFIYPKALGDGVKAKYINGEIKELLGFERGLTFSQGLSEQFKGYKNDYLSIVKYALQSGHRDNYQLDWYSLTQINIIYNKNGYIQLGEFIQGYSGGAHGNYSEGDLIYDMNHQRLIDLSDITTMDSVHLQKLIEAQFRKDHGLAPTDSLNTMLFDNHLPPNENFSFTQQGIQFTYNPYEVASFATGFIYVFISYEQLKGTLVPEFKNRMHLFAESSELFYRKPNESAADFVNRLTPDSATLIKNQVFKTKEFGTVKNSILSFYYWPFIQNGKQIDTYIKGYLWLPMENDSYKRIVIGEIYPNGGAPEIHSVFFANADHHPGRELVVLSKIPQIHYDYDGDFYDVYFFHYDRDKHRFTRIPGLSAKFFGCECSFRNGKTKHAKYKTAAEVRAGLKKMGY